MDALDNDYEDIVIEIGGKRNDSDSNEGANTIKTGRTNHIRDANSVNASDVGFDTQNEKTTKLIDSPSEDDMANDDTLNDDAIGGAEGDGKNMGQMKSLAPQIIG